METERLDKEIQKAEKEFLEKRDRLASKFTDYNIRAINEIRDGKRPDIVIKTSVGGELHLTHDLIKDATPGKGCIRVTNHPFFGDTLLPLEAVVNMSLGNLSEAANLYRQFKTQEEAVSKKQNI